MTQWEKLKQKSDFSDESKMSHTPRLTKVEKTVKNKAWFVKLMQTDHEAMNQNYFNVSP